MFALLAAAWGADWTRLQGTETDADAPAVRPWGFVQGLAEGIPFGQRPDGLQSPALAPYDGERPTFNRVGPGDASYGFAVRRARAGLRGAVPKTDGKVAWLLAAEFGDNGLTRTSPVVLADASVTWSVVPGFRLRIGQFKLPTGEEALENNPIAAEFVNFSEATRQLLLESPIEGGVYAGGVSAFRDVGLQAFDSAAVGPGELGYAVMLSNGRMGALDLDDGKDLTLRAHYSPWVWGERTAARRDELGAYAFWQQGSREDAEGDRAPRVRRGAGVKVERDGWRARLEVLEATGFVEAGPAFPGLPVQVAPDGRAVGGHAFVHHRRGKLGGGLRVDSLWRRIDDEAALRVFHTVTADAQVILTPQARLMLDYEARWLLAPGGDADARALAASMGDRVSLQAVALF